MAAPQRVRPVDWPWGLARVLLLVAVILFVVAWLIAANIVDHGNFAAWLAGGLVFFALSDFL